MFDIGENRAPGPDGCTSAFFKHAWSVIRKEICQAIKEFSILIITNRIKEGLDKLVNINQSAFVLERVIQDNLMITQELLKGYNFKKNRSRCSLNIDIAKAYDTVDWEFLREVLINFGFHEKMGTKERWSNISLPFHSGYRSFLLNACQKGHLLVLCHGDEVSVKVIKEALMEFSNSSGLKPNMEKSVVFFGSVREDTKQKILDILPFKVGKLPVKYLGVPLLAKKLGINDCKQLVEKVKNRIQDWKNRFLSYAGKLQLIQNDNWYNLGHLSQFVTQKDIHDARMDEDCSVADMIDNNKWVWPEQ
ncbi:RNA-directed DNA polymerase, eukaryota, reverse transcriptase zinc-binding domain protein [Tanacetum coccineum]|uniref:RNA-directed DNA polymerase, eukaryota, reverse transcriptase zinc-binding domain protein n=1 Tax=Tanacetum coccineum TaxID=301880 RepID=A0ABQ5EPG6_9ASTR